VSNTKEVSEWFGMTVMIDSSKAYEILTSIKPKSVVYLFSAGKDSALALLATRDVVKDFCKNFCKVYIVYVYITGNTHPDNAFVASYTMEWHRKHYGFEPIYIASPRLFTEMMCKYGFDVPKGRWCWSEFKDKPIREFCNRIVKPILCIDGVSPADSRTREVYVTSEIQRIESRGLHWSWHPLFSLNIDANQKLNILKQYQEFRLVAELYERYGDSMNCTICPYKSRVKLMKMSASVLADVYRELVNLCLHSERWRNRFALLQTNNLEKYIKCGLV